MIMVNIFLTKILKKKKKKTYYKWGREEIKVVFYWDQPFQVGWVGWVFSCSIGKKPFSVGLVAQLFQPASNWVETVEKETTEHGWKSILLENVNRLT